MDRVTKPQKKMLISMLKETKYMEGKKEKEWYWEKIQAALNMIGPKKTIIQWKKCWRDMRLTTRKKLAEIKRCQISGGSPPPGVELTHEDNDIIDIVGAEYFYEEINGDVKPTEHFLTGFEYVPEQFCDAILSGSKEAPGNSHDTIDVDGERRTASTSHTTNDTRTPPLIGFASTSNNPNNNTSGHPSAAAVVHQQLKRNREEFAEHRESHFDDKLIRLLHETFAVKRERRLRNRDPDKLFLLSLADEFKKIPDIYKLDVKTELIQVLNKWQKKSEKTRNGQKHQQEAKPQTAGNPRPADQHNSMPAPHPPLQHLQHNIYLFQKYDDKNVKPEQPTNEKQTMHSTQAQPAQNRDSGDQQHMSSQQVQHQQAQMQHNIYQLQKKYDDNSDLPKNTVPLQSSKDQQHKQHVEHHQQQQQQQQQQQHQHPHHHQAEQHPPSPTSTTLLQHPHPHSVMFPIQAIRNEQQSQHPHSQHSQQHHPPPLFSNPSTMTNNNTM